MKVLCAVDGSEFSRWGVEALGALAEQELRTVVLLHVVDAGRSKVPEAAYRVTLRRALGAADKAGANLLRRIVQTAALALGQSATAPRTTIRTVLTHGVVGETIVREAGRRRVDLLVTGSRGLSDPRSFLLGSVSRTVVSLASRPVLVVKHPLKKLARMVLAVDGSTHSAAAVRFLSQGLIPQSVHVTILSVVQPVVGNLAPRAVRTARRLVSTYRGMLLMEDFAVHTVVLEGHPSQTILDYVGRTEADLLIVGSRGETRTQGFPLGSVSERLIQHAPCSVLVVRGARA